MKSARMLALIDARLNELRQTPEVREFVALLAELPSRSDIHVETYRKRHVDNGLCRACKNPVSPGRTLCSEHLKQLRMYQKSPLSAKSSVLAKGIARVIAQSPHRKRREIAIEFGVTEGYVHTVKRKVRATPPELLNEIIRC